MAEPRQPQDPDDRRLETHPDLMNPEWQKYAERDAWLGAKKDLQKRRKRERRTGAVARPGQSRWPGILALLLVVVLVAAAIIVHQIQGVGVNEGPFLFFGS